MIKLITKTDVRTESKQIGKQINDTSFDAYVTRLQKRQLRELFGDALFYDFINFLENGFTSYAGTFNRDSATQITINNADVSAWNGYTLKLNTNVFVLVESAIFGGTDTVLTVSGYDVPETLSTVAYSSETKYTKLLNGENYTYDNNTIFFDGIRPFLCHHFVVSYLIDGNLKQNDVGNSVITGDLFQKSSASEINRARSEYLQNATSEYNRIIQYLDTKSSDFPLWESQQEQNLFSMQWDVI